MLRPITRFAFAWIALSASFGCASNGTGSEDSGWIPLFDGQTTAGWRGYRQATMPAGWTVEAGTLARTGAGGDIVTVGQYGDFVLEFEWKISERGNSGVFYRATEAEDTVYMSAPEFQVLDNAGHGPELDARHASGANYALHAPVRDVTRPVGEWNHARIEVRGDHVIHSMNGVQLVDYHLWTPEWSALVKASKFDAWPGYGRAKRGHIALQDHGNPVWYRNIRLRPLD